MDEFLNDPDFIETYAELIYTQYGKVVDKKYCPIKKSELINFIENVKGATKMICYDQKVTIFNGIKFMSERENISIPIYFGKRVRQGNFEMILCNNGEIIADFEKDALTSDEYLNILKNATSPTYRM